MILILIKDNDTECIYIYILQSKSQIFLKLWELRFVETNNRNFSDLSDRTRNVSATYNNLKAQEVAIS